MKQFIASFALLAAVANAANYTNVMYDNSPAPIYVGERLVSPNGKGSLTIETDKKRPVFTYQSVDVLYVADPKEKFFTHIKVLPTGQIELGRPSNKGGRILIGKNYSKVANPPTGNWKLVLGDDFVLKTVRISDGFVGWKSNTKAPTTDNYHWALTGSDYVPPSSTYLAKRATSTNSPIIYMYDTPVDQSLDTEQVLPSNMYTYDPEKIPGVSPDQALLPHGTRIAQLLASSKNGIARQFKIDPTIGWNCLYGNFLDTIINDFEYFWYRHNGADAATPIAPIRDANPMIFNIAIAFESTTSYWKCMTQWMFNYGIYMIKSAGNDNKMLTDINPYVLTVGAYDVSGNPATTTNYGPGIDIWAPWEFGSGAHTGTSISATFVSAAIAQAVDKYPILGKDPWLGFEYLKNMTKKPLANLSHDKVTASPNAPTNVLSFDFTTEPSSTPKTARPTIDFCTPLGLPANGTTAVHWGALYDKAWELERITFGFVMDSKAGSASNSGVFP